MLDFRGHTVPERVLVGKMDASAMGRERVFENNTTQVVGSK